MHDLPLLSTLVVNAGKRQLKPEAIWNIYNEARDLGLNVGLDAEAFVTKQADLARALRVADLPIEANFAAAKGVLVD
jgi:hypothetical protein